MTTETVRILFVGDVVGKPGRRAFQALFPFIKKRDGIDFCVVNAENAAGGSGINEKSLAFLLAAGADVVTTGDHIWRDRGVMDVVDKERRLLRPANLSPEAPGRGADVFPGPRGLRVGVANLLGRVFMEPAECPFRAAASEVSRLKTRAPLILVDFHAEATSEKEAMGRYLDGRVTAVIGTHTHVPTADERILPKGTAYITDIGMTGSWDSILGREVEPVVHRFVTGLPRFFAVAKGNPVLQGVVVEAEINSGRALGIRRIFESWPGGD